MVTALQEEEAMGDEKEVRKEDQDRINRFSRLHSKEKLVEEDLKTKQVNEEIVQLSETWTS
jgi:prefoldin subunit 4